MLRRLLSFLRRRGADPDQPSLNGLDGRLARYLDFRGGFFIEAGANDGYSQSNTWFLERRKGWRGVLVEGIPDLHALCVERRPASVVVNCALVSHAFVGQSVQMHFANLMSVVDGSLKSGAEQGRHLAAGVRVQGLQETYSIDVPARTLDAVLDAVPELPSIDFLSLDVEGYELQVLQGLDLARHRPRFILVEARFFEEVDTHLRASGYALVERMSDHDYFYRAT